MSFQNLLIINIAAMKRNAFTIYVIFIIAVLGVYSGNTLSAKNKFESSIIVKVGECYVGNHEGSFNTLYNGKKTEVLLVWGDTKVYKNNIELDDPSSFFWSDPNTGGHKSKLTGKIITVKGGWISGTRFKANRIYLDDIGSANTQKSINKPSVNNVKSLFVGSWAWFNGITVYVKDDGTVSNSVKGTGFWFASDLKNKRITIKWNRGGWIDELSLSPDNKTLDGHNQKNVHVFGRRIN